jgi:cytochrome b involved in lipid metabolism
MSRINLANYLVTNKNTDPTKIFDKTQLEKHNQIDNCYIGMGNGKVYDVSKYKTYLKNQNKNESIKFDLTCGSIADINPLSVFKTDKYIDYEVGDIKDFVYYKNIKIA